MFRAASLLAILALAAPPAASAERVAGPVDDAAIAFAPDGSPRIAFIVGGELFLATPTPAGSWSAGPPLRLPGPSARVRGLALDAGGRTWVLVQDTRGRWLGLAKPLAGSWRWEAMLRARAADATFGPAGLTLDRVGRPAVAYAEWLPSRATSLLLGAGHIVRLIRVTRNGFPPSVVPPAACPVRMPDGRIRVLETYGARGAAAILWRRTGERWTGRFLYSAALGTPTGPALARSGPAGFFAAWTVAHPAFGESHVVLAAGAERARTRVLHPRATLAGLALGPEGPEVAANEPVGGLVAGLLIDGAGHNAELDGRVVGLDVGVDGARHVLLARPGGLFAYRSPTWPAVRVSLSAARTGPQVALSGRVEGAAGGTVALYREVPDRPRELAVTASVAADGSFTALDAPLSFPLFYRAVYDEPLSGLPHAALIRAPVS